MMMNEELLARILARLEGIQGSLDRAENERNPRVLSNMPAAERVVQMFTCYSCAWCHFATEEQMIDHLRTDHGSGGPAHRHMGAKHERSQG